VLYGAILAELGRFRVSRLQVESSSSDAREPVTVRTASPSPLDPRAVRAHLADRFEVLSERHSFDASLTPFELVVECRAEGALPRNAVSGKIKTVIDRRLT
jgi:phenylacetate-CoA ligase